MNGMGCSMLLVVMAWCSAYVDAQDITQWLVYEYPNPRYEPQRCGRNTNEESLICDPNSLVSTDEGEGHLHCFI